MAPRTPHTRAAGTPRPCPARCASDWLRHARASDRASDHVARPGWPSGPATAAPTSSRVSSPAGGTATAPLPAHGSSHLAAQSPPRAPPAPPADDAPAPAAPHGSSRPVRRGPLCQQINRTTTHAATRTLRRRRCAVTLREGDVVVVWKIDRLGRNFTEMVATLADLFKREIHIVATSQSVDTSTPMGKAMAYFLGIVAEMEL